MSHFNLSYSLKFCQELKKSRLSVTNGPIIFFQSTFLCNWRWKLAEWIHTLLHAQTWTAFLYISIRATICQPHILGERLSSASGSSIIRIDEMTFFGVKKIIFTTVGLHRPLVWWNAHWGHTAQRSFNNPTPLRRECSHSPLIRYGNRKLDQ
jgi:hypothetical protein